MSTNISINRKRLIGRVAAVAVSVAIPLAVTSVDSAYAKTTHAAHASHTAHTAHTAHPATSISINVNAGVSAHDGHSGLDLHGILSADAGIAPGDDASDAPGGSNGSCNPSPAPSPAPSQSPTDGPSAPSSPAPSSSPSTAPADATSGDHCDNSGANLAGAHVHAVHARIHVKAGLKTAIKATVATAQGKVLATGRAVLLEGNKQISAAAVAAGKVTFTTAKFAQGTYRLHVGLITDTGSLITTKATLIVTAV